jgi:hypothetical protein
MLVTGLLLVTISRVLAGLRDDIGAGFYFNGSTNYVMRKVRIIRYRKLKEGNN